MRASQWLAACDAALGSVGDWNELVIVRNVGPLVARFMPGDNISNRGFNALLAGRNGASRFLKVRPIDHARFAREAAVTVALSRHPTAGALLPASTSFEAPPARVLAQEYVEGRALDTLIRADRTDSWPVLAAQVISAARPVLQALPDVVSPVPSGMCDVQPLRADLELLRQLGLQEAPLLAEALERTRLPAILQHGDFWPRNVVQTPAGWRLFDFENCGDICWPLYDVFHMIRGCGELGRRSEDGWLAAWSAAGAAAGPLREAVRQAAGDLDLAGIEAALVAYLVDFAARLHRRGISRERTAPRLRELALLPRLLSSGAVRRLLD